MKRILFITTIALLAVMTAMASDLTIKKSPKKHNKLLKTTMITRPLPLKAGDKIAIISPASTPGEDNPDKAAATLRAWGFNPVIGLTRPCSWRSAS